jgi:hypothetical protein
MFILFVLAIVATTAQAQSARPLAPHALLVILEGRPLKPTVWPTFRDCELQAQRTTGVRAPDRTGEYRSPRGTARAKCRLI